MMSGNKQSYLEKELAKMMCSKNIGDRLDTFEYLSEIYKVGRGTIQSVLNKLVEDKCFAYDNQGRNGRIITHINYEKLIIESGVNNIIGGMPLPYSKRFEGLATGLYKSLNTKNISCNFSFMSGSKNRLELLKNERYDFMVASLRTANEIIKEDNSIKIVESLSPHSFMKAHILVVRKDIDKVYDGMRIGLDLSSNDQVFTTMKYFNNINVNLLPIKYSNLIDYIEKKHIDGAIWSSDNLKITNGNVKILDELKTSNKKEETIASILCLKSNYHINKYIKINLDNELVKKIQELVVSGELAANY